MTTPTTLEERVTILETRLDTILPTLATKEDVADVKADIARLEGKMDAMNERLEGKIEAGNTRLDRRIDTLEYRLLLRFTGITATLLAIAVAAARFL